MIEIKSKNPAAVALGKLGKGIKKTGLTRAERKRRSDLARENCKKLNERRKKSVATGVPGDIQH